MENTMHLVLDEENNVLRSAEGVIVFSLEDQTISEQFVDDAQCLVPQQLPQPSDKEGCIQASSEEGRNTWSTQDIKRLIALYEEKQHLFKSSTTRNDKVWQSIAQALKTHSAEQCKNKFFYLKGRYTKQKDNMSSKATGARKITFAYFNEMDAIFGHEPNITPVAIASSSSQTQVTGSRNTDTLSGTETAENHTSTPGHKEQKEAHPSRTDKKLEKLTKLITKQQEDAERRHRENIEKKEEAIEALRSLMHIVNQSLQKD